MNGIPRQPGPLPANGQMPNGIGPAGQPPVPAGAQQAFNMTNAGLQPNGIPTPQGPPGTHPVGQPQNYQQQGPPGQRPLGPQQQRGPNGAPQFQSPTMAPSPQAQGSMPGQQPHPPMGQVGPSPHMSHRGGMPPPNGPQSMGNPSQIGSAHHTPTQSFQQIGRPPSRQNTPSQNPMNLNPSPSMAARQPPGSDPRAVEHINNELSRIPPDLIASAKAEAGLGDKDFASLSLDEKVC